MTNRRKRKNRRKKRSGGSRGGKRSHKKPRVEEKPLKAIILADSFRREFRPITLEKPKVMIPVVNIPLIDYVLDLILVSGIREVYVLCVEHYSMIKTYLSKSILNRELDIVVKHIFGAKSDAYIIQNIENYGIDIDSDFLLIKGDVVSQNINLKEIIEHHKRTKREDKQLLLTQVFVEDASKSRSSMNYHDQPNVSITYGKKRGKTHPHLLQHSDLSETSMNPSYSNNNDLKDVETRSNIIDPHFYICTPDVISVFSENPDYQDMKYGLVKGILQHQILSLRNNISPYIVKRSENTYCRRVSSLRSYESITADIIRKWNLFFVPIDRDENDKNYRFLQHNNYFEYDEIEFHPNSKIGSDNVIGSKTKIGENSFIENSVIGREVTVGKNVRIIDSYIFDKTIVRDNCVIKNSIIMEECILGQDVDIKEGSVITKLHGIHTKSGSILGKNKMKTNNDEDFAMHDINFMNTEQSEESEEISTEEEEESSRKEVFVWEVLDLVRRYMKCNYGVWKFSFEIRSLRSAYNKSVIQTAIEIILSIMICVSDEINNNKTENQIKKEELFMKLFEEIMDVEEEEDPENTADDEQQQEEGSKTMNWRRFILNFVHVSEKEEFEVRLLDSLLQLHKSTPKESEFYGCISPNFENVISLLNDLGIFENSSILEWSRSVLCKTSENGSDEEDVIIVSKCQHLFSFLKSLKEEEEEEGEGEDDIFGVEDDDEEDEESSELEDEDFSDDLDDEESDFEQKEEDIIDSDDSD